MRWYNCLQTNTPTESKRKDSIGWSCFQGQTNICQWSEFGGTTRFKYTDTPANFNIKTRAEDKS